MCCVGRHRRWTVGGTLDHRGTQRIGTGEPPENHRRVSLAVTADGKRVVVEVTDLWQTELARRLAPLSEQELRTAIGTLECLARCLL